MTRPHPTIIFRRLLDFSAQRPFVLTAAFILISGVVMTAGAFAATRFGRELGESTTIRVGTEFTSAEANLIANSYSKFIAIAILDEIPGGDLFDEDSNGLTGEDLIENELAELEDLVADGDLQHIGVFDLNGRSLWSLGSEVDAHNDVEPFQLALSGETVSFLNRGASVKDLDAEERTADLIESYVPFSLDDDDIPEAVLHVATDVTDVLATNIAATEAKIRGVVLTRLALLLGVLTAFVFVLDLSIMSVSRSVLATERSLRKKLDSQNVELQRLDQAKNEFLGSLSHELKTPLAAILGFTRIVKANKKGNLDERDLKQLQIVDKNGIRLDSLINDLLDLSSIQASKINLSREDTELSELVRSTVDGLLTVLGERHQGVSLNIEHTEGWLEVDQSRIAQVITNLVSNASKYSAEGSLIKITSARDEDEWVFSVEDNGMGIKSEHRGQLFTLFFRTPEATASAIPGTGIGLYVSKQIVDLHEGNISLFSVHDEGTTVTMRLSGVRNAPMDQPVEQIGFSNSFEDLESAV